MKPLLGLAAVLAAALLQFAAPAAARDQFGERDALSIDPQRSYIFFRTQNRLPVRFMREATEQDLVAWRTARARALARAQANHGNLVDRYRIALRACETRVCRDRPEPPVRATDENFAYPPAEAGNLVVVEQGPVFSREGESFTYLIAVPPGRYAVYGTTISLPLFVTTRVVDSWRWSG